MSDPCRKLQNSFCDILKDLMSMSADVIKKSNIQLPEAEALDQLSVSKVASGIKKLLSRVNTNMESFLQHFDTAMKEYQSCCENNNSQKSIPKHNLLQNGDKKETDIDLTQSDEELELTPSEKLVKSPKSEVLSIKEHSISKESVADDDVTDTDSEKSVLNFDVPVTKTSAQGLSDCDDSGDELYKALDQLDKLSVESKSSSKVTVREQIQSVESGSFDFDDEVDGLSGLCDDNDEKLIKAVDELDHLQYGEKNTIVVVEKERVKSSESGSFDFGDGMDADTAKAPPENTGQAQKDNQELLDLLNKAIGKEEAERAGKEGDEALEALKILEDEFSLSSDPDWDDDDDDKSMKSQKSLKTDNSDADGDISDTESIAEEPQPDYKLQECDINLTKRLDDMNDAEIARLCDLQNINKRKCVKDLKKHRRRRLKRIRLMSSSSSTSLSSGGSTTPDLVIDTFDRSPSPPNIEHPDISALADDLLEQLENEDEVDTDLGSSTDSDLESDSGKETERKEQPEEKEQDKEQKDDIKKEEERDKTLGIKSEDESEEKKKKTRGTWRDEIFFDTSSSDDETGEPAVVLNDPLEDKLEIDDEDDDSKEKVKLKIVEDGVTMIITDSGESNSDSDDVTFVDEVFNDGPRGRRNIRTILSDDELSEMTQRAKCEEDERILRVEERSKTIESIQSQHEEFVLDVDVKSGKPLITVDYNLARILKPHQKEGVKFIWEACYESVEILKKKPGTGCILAHCMGLGKTLQVITLIHTLFKHPETRTKHVLITCPLSTVTNWSNEFKSAFRRLTSPCDLRRFFIVKGDVQDKINTVHRWREVGGVLAMGYETFTMLTNEKMSARVSLLGQERTRRALLDPGPDLIICDEGHQLKNEKTLRTKALMKVKTKRRIVLTGTPLQNNLKEYYYMVEFVKPHLLGTSKEYTNRFATPIHNGQYHNSTPEDIKLMKKRTHVLTKLLKKTIHRVEVGVLSSYLPELVDYTIFVKLTPLQMELYTKYINMVKGQNTELGRGFFADIMMLNFNNLHPYTVQLYYNKPKAKKKKKKPAEEGTPDDEQDEVVEHVNQDWFTSSLPDDAGTNVDYSSKLKVVLDIVDESARVGDKVLIFAQKLVELDLLEIFFKQSRSWQPNLDYYRMDGKTNVDSRDHLCRRFNSNPACKVFLLTHRIGGLGLNLTGANRVIMIGSNHNPSLDTQSMYRIYRFGQKKKCYVYRLLSLATMEEKIYRRCVVKLHLSGTVVDKLHYTRKIMSTDVQEMYKVDFAEYLADRPIPTVPADKLLATLLQNIVDIYRYHPHNSLLENRPEDELTDEDKKLAWDEFNHMEEAAKHPHPVAPPVAYPPVTINPMLFRPPIYPANPRFPYNRFGQACATRATSATMVPNPLNNSVRGFIPRGLLTNGMQHHQTPPNANRVSTGPTTTHNVHHKNPIFHLPSTFNYRVGTPAPRGGTPAPGIGTPASRIGNPAPRIGTPAPRVGTPSPRVGTPSPRVGTPALWVGNAASRVGTPAPYSVAAPRTSNFSSRVTNSVPPQQTSNYGPRGTPTPSVGNPVVDVQDDDEYPASEVLRNLRQNISRVMWTQPRPAATDEATPSGEFNYALNKVRRGRSSPQLLEMLNMMGEEVQVKLEGDDALLIRMLEDKLL